MRSPHCCKLRGLVLKGLAGVGEGFRVQVLVEEAEEHEVRLPLSQLALQQSFQHLLLDLTHVGESLFERGQG